PDLRCVTRGAEAFEPVAAERAQRIDRRFQELPRVELSRIFHRDAAELPGHRHAAVGVDVDLADAVADAALDLFDWNAIGLRHLPAVAVDNVLQLLRDRGRT